MDEEHKIISLPERQIQQFVEAMRPPPEIRAELDVGFSFDGRNLELYEIRPDWQNPEVIRHSAFAKATFVKSKGLWKVFWLRASGKWEGYEPHPIVNNLREFFELVEEDTYGCFKG